MSEQQLRSYIQQTGLPYGEQPDGGDIWVYAGPHQIGLKSILLRSHPGAVQGRIRTAISGQEIEIGHGHFNMRI